jgi:hypothetical protein
MSASALKCHLNRIFGLAAELQAAISLDFAEAIA